MIDLICETKHTTYTLEFENWSVVFDFLTNFIETAQLKCIKISIKEN